MPLFKNLRQCETTKQQINIFYADTHHHHCQKENTSLSSSSSADDTLLMIPGLDNNIHVFDDDFVTLLQQKAKQLKNKELRIIRMDNRDSGQSTNFNSSGNPPMYSVTGLFPSWCCPKPLYTTTDMAKDVWALIDQLSLNNNNTEQKNENNSNSNYQDTQRIHLFGFSMGGAIIAEMLLLRPTAVKSFCPAMSSTFAHDLPFPSWTAIKAAFHSPKSKSFEDLHAHKTSLYENVLLSADAVKYDPNITEYMKNHHTKVLNHSSFVEGTLRQMNANAHGNRSQREAMMKNLYNSDKEMSTTTQKMKVFVLHGEEDKVVKVAHAERWREVFPQAKIRVQKTMGHFLEPRLWNEVAVEYVNSVF